MKKIIITINLILFSILTYSQTKIYEAPNGKTLTEEEYQKAKITSLENARKSLGSDYELYEKLEISEENENTIKYKFKWKYLNEEMLAEKLIEEKLIGKTLEFESLNFLNPKEKNSLDKNKPTFINFWFTNCPPCIEELPALNELKEKYKNKINFVSITFDTKERVEKFLDRYTFDFIHIVGEKEFIESLGFFGYPKTFLLDSNNIITSIKGSLPPKENEKAYKVQMRLMQDALDKLL